MRSMTLLSRYVLREFVPFFAIGLAIFTFLLVINQLFLVMDLFLNRGVELLTILKMVGLILPMFLPLSIPMAALLATLLTYGRFSEDGEITAFRSAGLTLFDYSWPNLLLGVLLSVTLLYFNLKLAPQAAMEFKNLHYAVAQQNPMALFAPKIMNHFGEYKVYVEKMDRRKRKLEGVSIYKLNPASGPTRILAPSGEIVSLTGEDLTIRLVDGAIHQPSQDKESQYTITKFDGFSLRIPARMEEGPRPVTAREMTFSQLSEMEAMAAREHKNPASWRTEKHVRIAVAFAPAVFILLGVVLGVSVRRGSRSSGIGMSIIVILLYYGLLVFVASIATQGRFPPAIAWFPNCVGFAAGGFLWNRLSVR